jgi:hypothetical protein
MSRSDKFVGGTVAWLVFALMVALAASGAKPSCHGQCKSDYDCWAACHKAGVCPSVK